MFVVLTQMPHRNRAVPTRKVEETTRERSKRLKKALTLINRIEILYSPVTRKCRNHDSLACIQIRRCLEPFCGRGVVRPLISLDHHCGSFAKCRRTHFPRVHRCILKESQQPAARFLSSMFTGWDPQNFHFAVHSRGLGVRTQSWSRCGRHPCLSRPQLGSPPL